MTETPPVIIIGGPTASGKSELAIALAEQLDGVVINADSMQVYRDLRILTARPGVTDEARVPHKLFGFLDAGDICSAARWRDFAVASIDDAHAAGRRAIVVGGTGLYLRALMSGLADVPPIPDTVRRKARARHAELGGAAFHVDLAERDATMAARLVPGDSQRTIRAWEVVVATGRSLADWQAAGESGNARFVFNVALLLPPRETLYASCDRRLGDMVAEGAVDEVRALYAGVDAGRLVAELPLFKALGVPEMHKYLRGETSLDAAIAAAQQATRRFAKRQMTWFRHQIPQRSRPPLRHIFRYEEKYSVSILDRIFSNMS